MTAGVSATATSFGADLAREALRMTEAARPLAETHAAIARRAAEFNRRMAPTMAGLARFVDQAHRDSLRFQRSLDAHFRSPAFQRSVAILRRAAGAVRNPATLAGRERRTRTRSPRAAPRVALVGGRARAPDGDDGGAGPPWPLLSFDQCRSVLGPECRDSAAELEANCGALAMLAHLAVTLYRSE